MRSNYTFIGEYTDLRSSHNSSLTFVELLFRRERSDPGPIVTMKLPESRAVAHPPSPPPEKVVLVTGSSGFLGQHIVKHLQEDDSCEEIRLFDIVPYSNKLSHACSKPMKEVGGDITDLEELDKAFDGVGTVIHCAALVDIGLFADGELLKKVNVEGTMNVIEACVRADVRVLVTTSTIDTMVTMHHIFYPSEHSAYKPKPQELLFKAYARSKLEAEIATLNANGLTTADGVNTLKTCVLRPTMLYGEEDRHFIPTLVGIARNYGFGVMPRVQSLDERFQMTYVGNAAIAHLRAKECLLNGSESSPIPLYFVGDDTPLECFFDSVKPFLEAQDVKMSTFYMPWIFAVLLTWMLCQMAWFLRSVSPVGKYFPTPAMVNYICTVIFVDDRKATLRLHYYPKYSYDDSVRQSLEYYKRLEITT